jgi:hypothetical protein
MDRANPRTIHLTERDSMGEYGNYGGPGRSNLRNPIKRALEDSLIRELRMRARIRALGFKTAGNEARIAQLKRQLGYH